MQNILLGTRKSATEVQGVSSQPGEMVPYQSLRDPLFCSHAHTLAAQPDAFG